jgi:hypothetical protein
LNRVRQKIRNKHCSKLDGNAAVPILRALAQFPVKFVFLLEVAHATRHSETTVVSLRHLAASDIQSRCGEPRLKLDRYSKAALKNTLQMLHILLRQAA